jgi:predicted amidohydrolase YtcJ
MEKPHSNNLALALCLALTTSTGTAYAEADLVFLNARAYTLDAEQPWAEAVAVENDRIVYVGDNAGAIALSGSETKRHDLNGKMLLPGFIDAHMHPLLGGAYAKALSLETSGTVEQWISAVDQYARAHPEKELLFGYGFKATTFGVKGPTKAQLDAIVPNRPVLIMDEGFHGAWANSQALKLLGINKDTPDPVPGFSYYKRDEHGVPTGYLLEDTANNAMEKLEAVSLEVIIDGTAYVIDELNSYGVTSVFDAGASSVAEHIGELLNQLENNGDLSVRIVGSHFAEADDIAGAVEAAVEQGERVKGSRYHYRMLKIMLDGTVEGRTAAMFEDYQGEPGNQGELVFTQAQTDLMVTESATKNIDVHIHGLGERAVHVGLNAIEKARKAHPKSESRYTICHVQVITDEDIPRFAELDVMVQSTPLWASYDEYGKAFVSDDQFSRFWRFKSLENAGARLTWGSDFPASGAGTLGMSPIVQMEMGITRQEFGQAEAPLQPPITERLDMKAMIRGYTIDAAYQLHMEDDVGSLEVGKKADLIVLDKNLFEVPTYEIHTVNVNSTFIDGEEVYSAAP